MKISIITPSYNSGEYIERAIKSVIAQDYKNFEHIIIDGNSTDKTLDILKKYKHLKWVSEPDNGQSDAMNKGFLMMTGDILTYLNADDYFLPGAFSSVIPYFQKGEKFVVGDVVLITSEGKFTVKPHVDQNSFLHHWEPSAFPNNPVQYFYLKEVQEEISYNKDNHFTMDLEFLLAVSNRYKIAKIESVLGVYIYDEKTKSALTQQKPFSYWSPDTFYYLDDYIVKLSKEEIIRYKNAQMKGYIDRIHQKLNNTKISPMAFLKSHLKQNKLIMKIVRWIKK